MSPSLESSARPNILVDTIPIAPGNSSAGVRVYLLELLEAIPLHERKRIALLCTRSNVELFEGLDAYRRIVLPVKTPSRMLRVLTQQLVTPVMAIRSRADVVFEPIDHAAVLCTVPIVTSLHSSHLNLAQGQMTGLKRWYNRLFLRLTVRRSVRVIAISRFVRETLVSLLGADAARIEVVHHGGGLVERMLRRGEMADPPAERSGGILFVSTLYPHKNVDRLLRAHALLQGRIDPVPPLTVVGGDHEGERARLEALAAELGTADQVRFLGRVTDDELYDLLMTSGLMVYPSALEGFGLPALEAMQAGLPLVASDRTSLPEVVGAGGMTVDPDDLDALAGAMARVMTEPDLRERLAEAGRARGEDFSWPLTARRTLEILTQAARAGRSRGRTPVGSAV